MQSSLKAFCIQGYYCVPYYQCDKGKVVIDGAGLFDIRSGFLDASSSKCNGDLEICCQLPKYRKSGKKKPFESTGTTTTIAITMTTGSTTTVITTTTTTTTTQFEGKAITTTISTSTETTTTTTSMTSSLTSSQFEGIATTTTTTTTHQPVLIEGSTEKGKPLVTNGSSKICY